MGYPTDRRYTNEHEWAKQEDRNVVIGITKYATESLGDVVYVELPKPGDKVARGQPFGVVESTKAVSELFAPLSGTVAEVNAPLADAPESLNSDPHGAAWIIKIAPADAADFDKLLSAEQYDKLLAESGH